MHVEKVDGGQSERISPFPRGRSRDFLGEALEGKRADALNHATGYAFAPDVDLDALSKRERRKVVHEAMMRFMSHKNWTKQVTQVIYDQEQVGKAMAGFGYITKKEKDISPRVEHRVLPMMQSAGVHAADPDGVFEMNFDAPWHHGKAYETILTGGMTAMLEKFFSINPNATVYMFVEDDDIPTDGQILMNVGARKIGSSVYLNNAKQEDLSDVTLDSIFVVNKQLFDQRPPTRA